SAGEEGFVWPGKELGHAGVERQETSDREHRPVRHASLPSTCWYTTRADPPRAASVRISWSGGVVRRGGGQLREARALRRGRAQRARRAGGGRRSTGGRSRG